MTTTLPNPLYDLIRTNADPATQYLHVVGFMFPAELDDETQKALMKECEALLMQCGGENAGILSLVTKPNLDPRKGFSWVEVGIFKQYEDFIKFHAHPAHKAFAEKISKVADKWIVLDVSVNLVLST